MGRHWLLPFACTGLLACQLHLAPGLASEPAPAPVERYRAGCRLNLSTHTATCPCAFAEDLEQLPDRPDLETLDMELDGPADPVSLQRIPALHALKLRNVTEEKLERVALLPQLDALWFRTASQIDLRILAPLKGLKSLAVILVGASATCDVSPLAQLEKLQKLTLATHCEHGLDLTPLSGLRDLREVTLYGVLPTTDQAAQLPKAKVVVHEVKGGGICELDPSACPESTACK
jgi:hypothetical protein